MNELELFEKLATSNITTIGVLAMACVFAYFLLRDKKELTEVLKQIRADLQKQNEVKDKEFELLRDVLKECHQRLERIEIFAQYGRRKGDFEK